MKKYILLIALLSVTKVFCSSDNSSEKFYFKTFEKCRMLGELCELYFFVDPILELKDLIGQSTDENVFQVDSVEPCLFSNQIQTCLSNKQENETIIEDRNVFRVKIRQNIIGQASVILQGQNSENANQTFTFDNYVVTTPRRIIDKIFDVWVWIFQMCVSFLMGVLIDRHSIVKIIKMPKAIFVGFFCQYLIMPMVNI